VNLTSSKAVELAKTAGKKRGRGKSAEEVYRTLKTAIIRMELAPGTVIDDVALGAQLGVSRQPIREAIIRLAGEGLVDSNRNRSSIVSSFNISNLRDFLDSITLLYRLTSRLAATNRRPEHLTRIKEILRTHSTAIEKDDVDGVVDANRQFHLAVAEAAGNAVYVTWVSNLLDHGERVMRLYLSQYNNHVMEKAMDGHRGIVDAIVAQDPDAAEASGALDARILAEGLSRTFLQGNGQSFSIAPSPAATGNLT
jgi:DNA-binding GntR family transcriptional regulator